MVGEKKNAFFASLLPPQQKDTFIVGCSLYNTRVESCRLRKVPLFIRFVTQVKLMAKNNYLKTLPKEGKSAVMLGCFLTSYLHRKCRMTNSTSSLVYVTTKSREIAHGKQAISCVSVSKQSVERNPLLYYFDHLFPPLRRTPGRNCYLTRTVNKRVI